MKAKLIFFIKHPSLTLKYISKYYPFTYSELNKYKNLLNWQAVSSNEQINFTDNIIRKFHRKWWNYELIQNPKVIWNSSLIKTFEKQILRSLKTFYSRTTTFIHQITMMDQYPSLKETLVLDWHLMNHSPGI